MFDLIIFGNTETNKPHQCYKVGIMGCKKITEIPRGHVGGLEAFSYKVEFENGDSVEIEDTIYVQE